MKPYKTVGFCHECRDIVDILVEDVGIGSYEFWGARGYDSRMIAVCSECGADVSVDLEEVG